MKKSEIIGVLGGSFNPVHGGHLALAQSALVELNLDRIYFVPARISPFKTASVLVSAAHRLAMLRLALRAKKWARISKVELDRPGASYTVDTVRFFRKRWRDDQIFLILGADAAADFHRWKRSDIIAKNCFIVVGNRNKKSFTKLNTAFLKEGLKQPLPKVSSSQIRADLAKKKLSAQRYLDRAVYRYIIQKKLYQS